MKARNYLLMALLGALLGTPGAGAVVNMWFIVPDDQSVHFPYVNDLSTAGSTQDFTLRETKDLNSDGDFLDAGETTTHISATGIGGCTGASLSPHFSCTINNGAQVLQQWTWRSASSLHVAGNYSIDILYKNGLGNQIGEVSVAVRITPAFLDQSITADGEQTRALINQSYSNETRLEHQQTRTLINGTSATSIAEHTHIDAEIHLLHQNLSANFPYTWSLINASAPGPGGCNNSCQQNISNLTIDGVSMMGIDLTDTISPDITFGQFLMIILWFLAFVWCAQNTWLLPAIFAFVGMFIPLFTAGFSVTMKADFMLFLIALVLTWAADRFELKSWRIRG